MPDLEAAQELNQLRLVNPKMIGPRASSLGELASAAAYRVDDASVGRRAWPEHRVGRVDRLRCRKDDVRRLGVPRTKLPPARVQPLQQTRLVVLTVEELGLTKRR